MTVPMEICAGQLVLLSAPQGLASYQWYHGNTEIAGTTQSTYLATETGVYLFNASSEQGCASGNCCSVYVNVSPAPIAVISGDTTLCSTESTTLTATGGTSFLWNTGETTASISVTPLVTMVTR